MKEDTFKKWFNSIISFTSNSCVHWESQNVFLCFDKNRMEGLLYDCDDGFSSLGYTDNLGYKVNLGSLMKICGFIDIISARKKVFDDFIEFRKDKRKAHICVEEVREIQLPVWEVGESVEIPSGLTFDWGRANYYFVNGVLYSTKESRYSFASVVLKEDMKDIYIEIPYCFIHVISNMNFSRFVVGDTTLFMSDNDLEITVFYNNKNKIENMKDDILIKELGLS